jgi:hypothetical protein
MEINIQSGIASVLASKKKMFPQHVNRISAMDDPCLRRLFYMRTAWDKAEKTDDNLQGVFETGTILEPVIERIVSEVGQASSPRWRIVGTQTTTNDELLKKYQISGTIDGFLQVESDGKWETVGVCDIKTMSPNVFPQVNSYDDLMKYSWTRRYRGQLMLYSLAHNIENCFILAVNKSNLFDMKLIQFQVDMQYCENLLQKASIVNQAVKKDTAPDGINDPKECPRCKFYSYCCPPISTGGNMEMVDNPELEAILNRISELEPQADEYDELVKSRDKILIQGHDVTCGNWIVQWNKVEKSFKPQPAKDGFTRTEWRKTIQRVA